MNTVDRPVSDPFWAEDPHLIWAVSVRWLVIGGFLTLAVIAHPWGLFPELRACAAAGVLGAGLNGLNAWCLKRRRAVVAVTVLAVPLDHVLITAVTAATGGIQSPFVMMYPVQVVTTALLISVRAGISSVILGSACAGSLLTASALHWVEVAPLLRPGEDPGGLVVGVVWFVFLVYCLSLLVFVAGYVSASMRRGERALAASTRRLQHMVVSLQSARDERAAAFERLKQAEAQLVQSEKMHALGQLVAGVAHELNNPLSFVLANVDHLRAGWGRLETLLDEVEGLLGGSPLWSAYTERRDAQGVEEIRADMPDLLADCEEGARRAVQIVGELRAFSRPERQDGWDGVDVNAGLRTTVKLLRHRIGDGVAVHLDLGALPEIRGLAGPLNQVFLNLLANAVDAVGSKGEVWVTTRSDAGGGAIVVRVSDDGCGIAPEHQKRVFDPFFTTKPVGQGTGLGLSVSYAIVQRHGGRIHLVSEPGAGATFEVWLPIRPEKV